jgi:U32 family peptidase
MSCEICALVGRVEDAAAMRAAGATCIYLDVIDVEPTDENLASVECEGLVPVLSEVCREGDHAMLDPWVRPGQPVAVGNLSELALAAERGAVAEVRSCVPAHNAATLGALAGLGAASVWLSPELSLEEAAELAALSPLPLGMSAYARPRLMTCEHCALQVAYGCDRNHATCPHRARPHWLVNIDERHLPVRTDAQGRSRVYLDEPVDLTADSARLAKAGIGRLLVDATTTSTKGAADAIARIRGSLAGESVVFAGVRGLADSGVE